MYVCISVLVFIENTWGISDVICCNVMKQCFNETLMNLMNRKSNILRQSSTRFQLYTNKI